jgi:hypothetical protein
MAKEGNGHFELICGLALVVLAALLAINDLGAGKFGGDELEARSHAEKAYAWYASKSLKENLAEGQRDMLSTLRAASLVAEDKASAVDAIVERLNAEAARYGREKKEILLGSDVVGKANWAQDIDGELGRVRGATRWESQADAFGAAGDVFDTATLFLQLCLVLGAISLILKDPRLRWTFFSGMLILGGIGIAISARAFFMAFGAA